MTHALITDIALAYAGSAMHVIHKGSCMPSRDPMSKAPVLLTPGPLNTSQQTRDAMTRDWGSRDEEFNDMMVTIRSKLLDIINGQETHVCVPLQGSGTFSLEAALGTLIPRSAITLVLVNGAYGQRVTQLCGRIGLKTVLYERDIFHVMEISEVLDGHPEITHIAVVHCETSVGILNPVEEIADLAEARNLRLIVDAMSSFGALPIKARPCYDAVIAASGKCLEGVPGMGFVLANKKTLLGSENQAHSVVLDLYDQYHYMEATGQWRFTPPTHVVAALSSALEQFTAQGGQPARLAKYRENYKVLTEGLAQLGFQRYIKNDENQAPIIVTFLCPADPHFNFKTFYDLVRAQGYALYPGKLTTVDTFRMGCIGDVNRTNMEGAIDVIGVTLKEMQVTLV